MTTDTDDLVALARECGAGISFDSNALPIITFISGDLRALAARLRAASATQGAADGWATLHGFNRDDLSAMADGLDCYEREIEGQESTTAACAKFIRAALSQPAGQQEPPICQHRRQGSPGECAFNGACMYACDAHPAEQAQGVSDAEQRARDWMGEHDVVLSNSAYAALLALLSTTPAQPTAAVRESAWVYEAMVEIVRDVAELEPADPKYPRTLCVHEEDLRTIIKRTLFAALTPAPTEAPAAPEPMEIGDVLDVYDSAPTGHKESLLAIVAARDAQWLAARGELKS